MPLSRIVHFQQDLTIREDISCVLLLMCHKLRAQEIKQKKFAASANHVINTIRILITHVMG